MNKLKELREERALSMRELSAASGITTQTIYRIEHGQSNVRPRTVRKLAEALGVAPKALLKDRG